MRNRKGMTLVEVIVAMALFAIVMVTIFTAFIITNMMNNVSKEFSDASYLAQNEMEIIYSESRGKSLKEVIDVLEVDYTCIETKVGINITIVCNNKSDPKGNFDFVVRFNYEEKSIITRVVVEVESTSGEYAGDRAQVENHVIFKAGG